MKKSNKHPLHYSVHSRLREYHIGKLLCHSDHGFLMDIGCGLGYWLKVFGPHFDHYTGIELDLEALKCNKSEGIANMIQGSAFDLPVSSQSMDVIICSEVLEHLPENQDEKALAEMARLLKPGGRIIITVPALEGLRATTKLRNLGHDIPGSGEYHYRLGYSYRMIEDIVDRIPSLKVSSHRFSMFLFSELLMDLQKWYFHKKSGLKEHSDIRKADDSAAFQLYKLVFPLLYFFIILEDTLLCPLFKGHILIAELERNES